MKLRLILLTIIVPIIAVSQNYNYYFGNLHAHTAFSDGNKDAATSGVNNPTGSYAYAKLSQNFNFLGISEHNHYSNNNPGFQKANYPVGLSQAAAANQEGTFLSLFGMEWGVSSSYNGHIVIYGFNQLIGWETNNYDIFNAKTDYDGIFRKVKDNPNAFCYLAHPSFSDFSTAGTSGTSLAYSPYNAAYDSAIIGTPLRSGLAFSTFTDYSDYPSGNYFLYYRKLLAVGYHLGIGYDHDNHYTNFGRSNAGRLVIVTPTLTTANLFAAMKQRNFYASDDWNAKVEFKIGNNIMGSITSASVYPTINITHNDGDGEMADSIKIWRGISGSQLYSQIVSITKQNNTAVYTDNSLTSGNEFYYFAEIKQNDGQWIVTSPIWFTYTGIVGVKENSNSIHFNIFPNPLSDQLSVSVDDCENYTISIFDMKGSEVLHRNFNESSVTINTESLAKGVYTLKLVSGNRSAVQKLVIN